MVVRWILAQFGLWLFDALDVAFPMTEHVNLNNMAGFFITEKLTTEDIKHDMFLKGILKFPWLWSTIFHWFGLYIWRERSPELAKEQVKRISKEMHTREELIKYTEDLFEQKFFDDDF